MNYTDFVDLYNPQAFYNAVVFACCLISMIAGAFAKGLFMKGRWPQSAFLIIALFVFVGFLSHYSFPFFNGLIDGF